MHLDTSFVVIDEGEPADLSGDPRFAVVMDDTGHVVALGTAMEVARGEMLAAGVEVPASMRLDDLLDSDAATLLPLNPHGAVVVRDGVVVGVLTADTIDAFLHTTFAESRQMGVGGDSVLPGDIRVPAARVACAWPGCGHLNVITFYDPDRPDQCANPDLADHAIALPRR